MKKTTLLFTLALFIAAYCGAQSPFTETYFLVNNPKPTGEVTRFIRTPDMLYIHAKAPHGIPYARECMFAVDPEGKQVWSSFGWGFESDSELYFQNMFLASDGSLYITVQETIDFSNNSNYLLRVHGGSGGLIWKLKIPDGQTIYQIVELAAGAISVLYRDANANFNTFLKTLSSQDGSVLQNVYLSNQYVGGIVADLSGNLVYVTGNVIHRVNSQDPALAYWHTVLANACQSAYSGARFTFNPDGQTMVFWGNTSTGGVHCNVEAIFDLNTGLFTIVSSGQIGFSAVQSDLITRGDTVFTCTETYGSRFGVTARRVSDATAIYSKGYYINNPATGQPYNPKAVTQSLDIDRDGNLFVAGRSCQDLAVGGIIGVVKVRASDGAEIWNKIVDITPGDKDEFSNARIVWCPPSSDKLWVAGVIQVNPGLKTPVLFELDKNTGQPLQKILLGGNYDYASAFTQFLPVAGGFCALKQLDNCIAVSRYDASQQLLWEKEICRPQLIKAGGIYAGKDNSLFVTGTNFYTLYPIGQQQPFAIDSVFLYKLDLNTGNATRVWKISAPQGGYPVHVSALTDTISFFVHNNQYRRSYRIINNFIQSYAGTYQSNVTDKMPLLPLKTTYVQRGRETIASLSATKYMVWLPNTQDGASYDYPATTNSVKVGCIAAINNKREIVAAGQNGTVAGWGIFRFQTGKTTAPVWQNSGSSGQIQRMLNVKDETIYSAGCNTNTDRLYIKKLSAGTGQLVWEKFVGLNNDPEVNDMAFDTTTGKLLLCGSIADPNGQRTAWLVQLDSNGVVTGQSRRDGDTPGPANRALCVQDLPSGQFVAGGQLQRNGLDTAAFIWNGIPDKFLSAGGKVYCDLNDNSQKDTGEPAYVQTVSVSPGAYNYFPDVAGNYRIDVLSYGTYEATVLSPSPHYSVKKASFTLSSTQSGVAGADIRLTPLNVSNKILDAAIELAEIRPARFGFETALSVNLQNLGALPLDSFAVELDCGNQFSFTGLSTLNSGTLLHPFKLSNGTLSAAFKGADVLQQRNFVAYGKLNTFLLPGDTLLCTARVTPFPANDAVAGNNLDSLLLIVQGSYDPNDITAYPQDRVTTASLDADGSLDLMYRIRFENTGNTNADFLRVVTDYSPLLRPGTFRLGAVSAPCTVRFLEGNRMEFSFPNYLLPPTLLDSVASKGFVFFRMRTVPGLIAGDTIKNKAEIYFDFNPPIHTNTALTWVENGSTPTDHPAGASSAFMLHPNPVQTGTVVRFAGGLLPNDKWQMYSLDGRFIAEGRIADGVLAPGPGAYRVFCRGFAQGLMVVR